MFFKQTLCIFIDASSNLFKMENRKSKFYTGDKKELGEHEKATFDLQVTLVKLQTKKVINNIKLYVAAKTVDNGYRYKEYSSSTKTMSEYTSHTPEQNMNVKNFGKGVNEKFMQ